MTNKERYQATKSLLVQQAQEWQTSQEPKTYSELARASDYFTKYGKRYGLIKEFRANGII